MLGFVGIEDFAVETDILVDTDLEVSESAVPVVDNVEPHRICK